MEELALKWREENDPFKATAKSCNKICEGTSLLKKKVVWLTLPLLTSATFFFSQKLLRITAAVFLVATTVILREINLVEQTFKEIEKLCYNPPEQGTVGEVVCEKVKKLTQHTRFFHSLVPVDTNSTESITKHITELEKLGWDLILVAKNERNILSHIHGSFFPKNFMIKPKNWNAQFEHMGRILDTMKKISLLAAALFGLASIALGKKPWVQTGLRLSALFSLFAYHRFQTMRRSFLDHEKEVAASNDQKEVIKKFFRSLDEAKGWIGALPFPELIEIEHGAIKAGPHYLSVCLEAGIKRWEWLSPSTQSPLLLLASPERD